MEDIFNLISKILQTHDRVMCYPIEQDGFGPHEKYITYKETIPIYVRELNNSLDLDSYSVENCDIYNNLDCENYPRCYCQNHLEIWKLDKVSDIEYIAKAYLHASKVAGDFIFPTITKINGKWYMKVDYDCEEYELLL